MFKPITDTVPDYSRIGSPRPTVVVPLTYDGDARALLEVRLWPKDWSGYSVDELEFLILVVDENAEEPEEIWDRYKASAYVETVRARVIEHVCESATKLVSAVQPEVIVMRTWAEQPHPKSFLKYEQITIMLGKLGYVISSEGLAHTGRYYWVMVKDGGA